MGRIRGRIERLERSRGECPCCSGVVLCIGPDGQPTNGRTWREYGAGCPSCGRRPPTLRAVWDDEDERGA
jgi:hypothetical protein